MQYVLLAGALRGTRPASAPARRRGQPVAAVGLISACLYDELLQGHQGEVVEWLARTPREVIGRNDRVTMVELWANALSDVVHAGLRATSYGTCVLSMYLLGVACSPIIVGALSDHVGIANALLVAPVAAAQAQSASARRRRRVDRRIGRL